MSLRADAPRLDSAEELLAATAGQPELADAIIEGGFSWPAENIEISFRQCRFEDCILSGAELEGSRFEHCEFAASSLRGAQLRDAVFEHCKFYIDEQVSDLRYAELRDVRFEDCDLTMANFQNASAYGLKLVRCQAQGADFSHADFGMAMSRNHTVIDLMISDSNLAYADFSATYLAGCAITDTRMNHAILTHCDLGGATLTGCELNSVEAASLDLSGADLRGSRFNNLDPRLINLTDAKIDADQALSLLTTLGIDVQL